jgi:hypothetical protein
VITILILALPTLDTALVLVHWKRTRAARTSFWAGHLRPDLFGE